MGPAQARQLRSGCRRRCEGEAPLCAAVRPRPRPAGQPCPPSPGWGFNPCLEQSCERICFFSWKRIPKEPRRNEWPTDRVRSAPVLQSPQQGPAGGGCGPCSPAHTWTLDFPPRHWEALTPLMCDPEKMCSHCCPLRYPSRAGGTGWMADSYILLAGLLRKGFPKAFPWKKVLSHRLSPTPSHKHLCVALPRRCFPMARSA